MRKLEVMGQTLDQLIGKEEVEGGGWLREEDVFEWLVGGVGEMAGGGVGEMAGGEGSGEVAGGEGCAEVAGEG